MASLPVRVPTRPARPRPRHAAPRVSLGARVAAWIGHDHPHLRAHATDVALRLGGWALPVVIVAVAVTMRGAG